MVPFIRSTMSWSIGLTSVAVVSLYASSGGLAELYTFGGATEAVLSRLAIVLPFAAFAGGLSVEVGVRGAPARVMACILSVAVFVYVASAVLVPIVEFRAEPPDRAVSTFPLGAETPSALLAQHRAVVLDPPAAYSFSVSQPLARPPNWILFKLFQPGVAAMLASLSCLVGVRAAAETALLEPRRRRLLRWSIGVGFAAAYLAAAILGSEWVRQDPTNSALTGAAAPLAIPLAILAALASRHNRTRSRPDL